MPLPENAIETIGLGKIYGRRGKGHEALVDVDLAVPRGTVFGLLGPNGAGKSTLINILAGLVVKSRGTARIWGNDIVTAPRAARASIGIVPQEPNIDAFFTPRELLELQAGLYGVPPAERRTMALLEIMGLTDKAGAHARELSGGMRRRLLIAKALVHSPPVIVLDEPTAGVDIELRQALWSYVRDLNARGTTVLLTTHYLEEAEELCERIAIIDHGRIVACDTTQNLLQSLDSKELRLRLAGELTELPPALVALGAQQPDRRTLLFRYRPSSVHAGTLIDAVQREGLVIADVTTVEADLEDIFLSLTGRNTARSRGGDNAGQPMLEPSGTRR